jgi:hypothetical protein
MTPQLLELTKDLTQDNITERIQALIDEIGTTNYTNSIQTGLMFIYHNKLYPNKMEHTQSCSSCRLRVYNKLCEYLKTNNDK